MQTDDLPARLLDVGIAARDVHPRGHHGSCQAWNRVLSSGHEMKVSPVAEDTTMATSSSRIIDRSIRAGRRQRFEWLMQARLAIGARPVRILDVGGTMDYWSGMDWARMLPATIVLLNLEPQTALHPFTAVVGDARDLSRFETGAFDLVYAHSVIGHVGRFVDQARMAQEIRRVGRSYVVQTPNHAFPLDWRTLWPGLHWLPSRVQAALFRRGIGYQARDYAHSLDLAERIRNLTRRELQVLFPGATIRTETIGPFTKSFVVVGARR